MGITCWNIRLVFDILQRGIDWVIFVFFSLEFFCSYGYCFEGVVVDYIFLLNFVDGVRVILLGRVSGDYFF